jgi:hypothetical protein
MQVDASSFDKPADQLTMADIRSVLSELCTAVDILDKRLLPTDSYENCLKSEVVSDLMSLCRDQTQGLKRMYEEQLKSITERVDDTFKLKEDKVRSHLSKIIEDSLTEFEVRLNEKIQECLLPF